MHLRRIVGPLDGRRARRTRCDACAKRRIKCHGGIPCVNCSRTKRECKMPPGATTLVPVFVGNGSGSSHVLLKDSDRSFLTESVYPRRTERYFSYFFTSFLPTNTFANKAMLVDADLLAMAHSSPVLQDVILAVSAFHLNRLHLSPLDKDDGPSEISVALRAYGRCLHAVQGEISQNTFTAASSALWVTFLLGLFELMRDATGTGWLAHFLQGTSIILRLQSPESLLNPDPDNLQKRTFFLATRIFEISRSLIYSSPTFLSRPEWISTVSTLWDGDFAAMWHPKEALFDLLPRISDLSIRAIQFCRDASQIPQHIQLAQAEALAVEGLAMQMLLEQWRIDSELWQHSWRTMEFYWPACDEPDTEFLVACVYYHAICIYLSGTYDYHSHWTYSGAPHAPILPRCIINHHVSEILRISHILLTHGIAGVLLFFPLRVAGARAMEAQSRTTLLTLLQTISAGGFIVADAFTHDLSTLWERKS